MNFQWYAGNLACKGLMMVRTGGYILSSLMLIVLSIDRCKMISIIIQSLTVPWHAPYKDLFLQINFGLTS